jgi:hypothetical protein
MMGICCAFTRPGDPANDAELARAKISQPSYYLVRPDGYIGLCGPGINREALARYLRGRLHVQLEEGRA